MGRERPPHLNNMYLAFIITILQFINIASVTAGEIFFILFGTIRIFKIRKIISNQLLRFYLFCSSLLIVFIIIYPLLNDSILTLDLKNLFKYLAMIIVSVITYMLIKIDYKKFNSFLLWLSLFTFIHFVYSSNYNFLDTRAWHSFFPLLFILALFQFKKVEEKYIFFYCIAMLLAIYGSSRTSQMTIIVLLIYTYYQNFGFKPKKLFDIPKRMLLFSGILIILYFAISYLSESLTSFTASNLERSSLLASSINIFKDNLFFGVGLGNFSWYSNLHYGTNYSFNMTPHNYFLETLVELGIVGGALVLIPYLNMLRYVIQNAFNNRYNLYKYIFIYLFVILNFNVMSGQNRFIYSILLGATFIIGDDKGSKSKKQNGIEQYR